MPLNTTEQVSHTENHPNYSFAYSPFHPQFSYWTCFLYPFRRYYHSYFWNISLSLTTNYSGTCNGVTEPLIVTLIASLQPKLTDGLHVCARKTPKGINGFPYCWWANGHSRKRFSVQPKENRGSLHLESKPGRKQGTQSVYVDLCFLEKGPRALPSIPA